MSASTPGTALMTKYESTKNHGYHIANQVFLTGNIAIAMSYFAVGFTGLIFSCLIRTTYNSIGRIVYGNPT